MEFFRVRKFRKGNKTEAENGPEELPKPKEPKGANGLNKSHDADPVKDDAEEDDGDDDFVMEEVQRKLKELRRNSFMVVIPEEESCAEEEEGEGEEAGETTSSDWTDVEAKGREWWGGFDVFYERYCERMLYFDKMSAQQLNESGCASPVTPSPRSASKKLSSPLRCLSLKKYEEPDDETEVSQKMDMEPYQDLETTYVAHICLTWEALHCQFTQMSQKISCQMENLACYNHSAQQFQQFQVLLQRFIENEPFENCLRPESYARARKILPKLLQVPNIRASEPKEMDEGSESRMLAADLMKILESSILTFHLFLKMDKHRGGNGLHLFRSNHHAAATPLQQVQSQLDKKVMKLKELEKKCKGWNTKSWPLRDEDVQLLFSLIDVKILSRVLRMERITKEQLFWCEEKMKKLDVLSSDHGKLLHRDPSPILFPC